MRKVVQLAGILMLCLSINKTVNAQTRLSLRNFAVFGGDSTASFVDSLTSGIQLGFGVRITGGGAVGSQTFLRFGVLDSIVNGNVYGNIARIDTGFTLNGGSLFIFNRQGFNYNVLQEGPQPIYIFPGNITVNGNSFINATGGGVVNGSVTHPTGTTYSGPSPDLGETIATPVFPQMPKMPDTTAFPGAGTTNIFNSQTIVPGIYGSMFLLPQQALTFSGVGTYVFNSIADSTNDTLKFDFKNNTTGSMKVYVAGNVDLNSVNVVLLNGGDPSRIYFENHGTSFVINRSANFSSNFSGIIYAPLGNVIIGNPNAANIQTNIINGSIWSRKQVILGNNTFLNFIQLSNSANPAADTTVRPYYPPPATGKTNTLIGSELTSLYENFATINRDSIIYQIKGDSILIEVIAIQGQYANTLAFLQTNGLRDIINNGPGNIIISGRYPIANLPIINTRPDLVDYARPLFFPINNSGIVTTKGDTSMYSNLVRTGYNLAGSGVTVGVISDSYNTIPGNYAGIDIANGDLPGPGNPYNNTTPVNLVQEYPYGQGVDEGRAMLQIVHDIAPKAQLAFRTGFVSAGDFAQGIGQLTTAGCKVIVDDVTYITEPYYTDGVIAQAVNTAVASGTTYFSAAGNFGRKSYEGSFKDMAVPANLSSSITGTVHDFGGGNPFQTLNLVPGNYTIVLQWQDNIYSLGAANQGTQTDLDVYMVDNLGSSLFGFNRNNMGTDPLEVLPFTVTANTTANLLIAKNSGPDVSFKYIVFRGDLKIGGYSGASTIVGQANAAGAIAVGAVLYSNTPPYGLAVPTIASFSSVGGTMVNGAVRQKPELTAPNGVNTTVNFGSTYDDGDHFPNFFGTSAAAPHAAAAAALLIEGKKKFLGQTFTPSDLKTLFERTAIDMGTPGYDTTNGYGFIQPFAAMQTFASPIPELDSIVSTPPVKSPVTAPFVITVKGKGLTPQTKVFLSNTLLTTSFVDNQTMTARVPAFTGNPPVYLTNPSIIPAAQQTSFIDGGISDSLYFFSTKKNIIVTAKDTSKKYGEKLPLFTVSITVDGVPIQNTTLTPADLKLDHLTFTTPATTSSNVANYFIQPVNPLNPRDSTDSVLLTKYNYQFVNGVLTINKLPLKITPRDTTLTYGQQIHGLKFNYSIGPSSNLQNPDSLASSLQLSYTSSIIDSILVLTNGSGASSRALVNNDLLNLSIMISSGSGASSRALVNNGQTTHIVDVSDSSIFYYEADSASSPLVNGSGASSRALVNTGPLINGTASILVNGSGASSRALVNGNPDLLNSTTTGTTSNSNVAVVISANDVPNAAGNSITETSANMVTDGINIGTHKIVPAAFISGNYEITYGLGTLTIKKAPLTITANTLSTNNGVIPAYTSTFTGYQYQDASIAKTGPVYTLSPAYSGNPGTYTIKPSALSFAGDSNYIKTYVNGVLYVNPYTNTGKKITLSLKCVGTVTNGPSGLKYIAHFIGNNPNSTTIYVALGVNNYITATGIYSGIPPVVFPKGSTKFDVYFDGKKITWTLKTLQTKVMCTESISATSTSCKCSSIGYSDALNLQYVISSEALPDKTVAYPNPATNTLNVTSDIPFENERDVKVFDANGRIMPVKATLKSVGLIELNVSQLKKGTYFIWIRQQSKTKTVSFIKL